MKTITLEIDERRAAKLDKLAASLGADLPEIVGMAIDALDDGSPPSPAEDAAVRAGLDDIAAGRLVDQDVMFARLRARFLR